MKKTHTTLFFGFTLGVFLVALGITLFFVRTIERTNIDTSLIIKTLESKIKDKENRDVLEKRISEARLVHNKISDYLIDSENIGQFITGLETLGTLSGVSLDVKSVDPVGEANPNALVVSLSSSGTFPNLMQLFSLIETMPYDIHIVSAYFNKDVVAQFVPATKKRVLPSWVLDLTFTITTQ